MKELDLAGGGGPIISGLSNFYTGPDPDPVDVEMAGMHRVSNADLLAAVRAGVESGTIEGVETAWVCHVYGMIDEGEREECFDWHLSEKVGPSRHHERCGWNLVIPLSDGEEDRP